MLSGRTWGNEWTWGWGCPPARSKCPLPVPSTPGRVLPAQGPESSSASSESRVSGHRVPLAVTGAPTLARRVAVPMGAAAALPVGTTPGPGGPALELTEGAGAVTTVAWAPRGKGGPTTPQRCPPLEDPTATSPRQGTRGHPQLLTSRVVPQPPSGCSSRYPSPSAPVTPQPDPSLRSPLAARLPRRAAGTVTESHARPHVTETAAGRGDGGLSRLTPSTDVPSSPPILALGGTGKEVAPGAEPLRAVTPAWP